MEMCSEKNIIYLLCIMSMTQYFHIFNVFYVIILHSQQLY